VAKGVELAEVTYVHGRAASYAEFEVNSRAHTVHAHTHTLTIHTQKGLLKYTRAVNLTTCN